MSTALAIAAVTAVLKDLLQNGVVDQQVANGVGSVQVSALPPDRIPVSSSQDSRLNLYMYCVTPNQGWRNHDLPSFNSSGNRKTNPPLALDLHYLLTAYGNEEFHAEILLGFAMQLLHENPILPRSAIQRAFTPQPQINVPAGNELPAILRVLRASDLVDQLETVKITPRTLDSEEISRLWGAFQTHYRPTAAYIVSVVLIESSKPVKPTLPVLTPQVAVTSLRHPEIDRVSEAENALIQPESTIEITGSGFSGEIPTVQIDGVNVAAGKVTRVNDRTIRVVLPAGLSAGVHSVQVIHPVQIGNITRLSERSNVAPFILHPTINKQNTTTYDITVANVTGQPNSKTITLRVTPDITPTQQTLIELIRADGSMLIFTAAEISANTNTLVFTVTGMTPGEYFVRVRIDSADSPFETNTSGQITAPKVTIT